MERGLFHDPAFVTKARVEHTFALAQRPHSAEALLDTIRSLGTFRGIRLQWRQTLLRAVADLDIPTLVVWGDHDLILPAAYLDAARAYLPTAQVHLFPDTGHMPQIERAEAFSQLVEKFWTTVSRKLLTNVRRRSLVLRLVLKHQVGPSNQHQLDLPLPRASASMLVLVQTVRGSKRNAAS